MGADYNSLMKAMGEQTGPFWVRECSTLFADDLLIHYEFHSKPELDKFLPNLAKCLAILKSIGLQVQHSKTQVGRQFKLWRKKHTRKTKDGPRLVLWSEQGQSQQMLIVTSATYLGIKVSYQNIEKQTLQRRLAAANAQSKEHVCSKFFITNASRLRGGYSCGLHASGVPPSTASVLLDWAKNTSTGSPWR